MKKIKVVVLSFGILMFVSCSPHFKVSIQESHSVLGKVVKVKKASKLSFLRDVNRGLIKLNIKESSLNKKQPELVSLLGERQIVEVDIEISDSKKEQNFIIKTNLPKSWQVKIYRQALLNEWYSTNKNTDDVRFVGDALLQISNDKGVGLLKGLRSNEKARLVIAFYVNDDSINEIDITVKSKGSKVNKNVQLEVLNSKLPKVEFSSIIFNTHNIQSGSEFVSICSNSGLTHLQANYIPTVYFDKRGNPLGGIDMKTVNSTGYRGTIYPWIKSGGSVALFWQPRYGELAPLKDGSFLKPFTKEWMVAFSKLLEIVSTDLETKEPGFTKEKLVLYLVDEFSSGERGDSQYDYSKLISFLAKVNPKIKTLVTYGFYSSLSDVKSLSRGASISSPHFLMPKKTVGKRHIYQPSQIPMELERLGLRRKQKWTYWVAKGKSSDIREFLLLPMIAVKQGYSGFSWWGFLSHTGSTWTADDGNRIDYSLVYLREQNNKIYQTWKGNDENIFITSMRMKAIQNGLANAKILWYLIENKNELNVQNRNSLNKVLDKIDSDSYTYEKNAIRFHLGLDEINEISNEIRRLYSSCQVDNN